MKTNNKLFFLTMNMVIVFIVTTICLILHQFAPDVKKEGIPLSIFFENGLFIPIVTLDLIITFALLAFVFQLTAPKLNGTKTVKALKFGVPFAFLWILGFFEGYLYYGTSFKHDLLHGLVDGFSIIVLSFLLSFNTINNSANKIGKTNPISIIVICLFYFAGRYILYLLFKIESAVFDKPYTMILWTFLIGLTIGIMYFLFEESLSQYSSFKKAIWFGVVILGINWIMFYSFAPIFQELSFIDNFSRPIIDILLVTQGVYIYQKFINKNKLKYVQSN